MMNLQNTKALVQSILEQEQRARNSDYFLYFVVIKTVAERHSIDLKQVPVTDFLLNMERSSIFPPFESVRRSRQKVQAECPWLAAADKVNEFRAENEEVYREFARA